MLLIQIHQLHLVVGLFFSVLRLEDEGDRVGVVLRSDRAAVVIAGTLQDLGHAAKGDQRQNGKKWIPVIQQK